MGAQDDNWDAYFWPSEQTPGARVLRNKFGIRDRDELEAREYAATAKREWQLTTGRAEIPRTGDAREWKAIHGHLFRDVFDWAGTFRTVDMHKGGRTFLNYRHLDPFLGQVCDQIRAVDWSRLGRGEFVDQAARAWMYVNFAHPFREGNGRSGRAFLSRLTADARFELDLDFGPHRGRGERWNEASKLTVPESYGLPDDHTPLLAVFDEITVDRGGAPEPPAMDLELARTLEAAARSYPIPASEAVRYRPQGGVGGSTSRPVYGRDRGQDLGR